MTKLFDKEIEKTKKKEESNRNIRERIDTVNQFLFDKDERANKGEEVSEAASDAGNSVKWNVKQGNKVKLTLYDKLQPTENDKLDLRVRHRVTMKDFIYALEQKTELPNRELLLHKAMLMMNGIYSGDN